jgi:hypothetical protein
MRYPSDSDVGMDLGPGDVQTAKFPSDSDEDLGPVQTLKFPSDSDEDMGVVR